MSITKKELWEIYIDKNPHWKTENVTLTPEGLQKLVEQSHQHGFNHGKAIAATLHETIERSKRSKQTNSNPFGDIFGGGI